LYLSTVIKMSEEETPTPTKKPVQLPELEEEDDTTILVNFRISKTTYKKLGQIALDRETPRASLIREAIKEYLKMLENPEEKKLSIPDRQLDKLLKECSYEDGGLELDGEDGFIEAMKAKGFKLKDLTPNQWLKVKERIQEGINKKHIEFSSGKEEEFAEKFDDLEPSDEQYNWLSTDTTEEEK